MTDPTTMDDDGRVQQSLESRVEVLEEALGQVLEAIAANANNIDAVAGIIATHLKSSAIREGAKP